MFRLTVLITVEGTVCIKMNRKHVNDVLVPALNAGTVAADGCERPAGFLAATVTVMSLVFVSVMG